MLNVFVFQCVCRPMVRPFILMFPSVTLAKKNSVEKNPSWFLICSISFFKPEKITVETTKQYMWLGCGGETLNILFYTLWKLMKMSFVSSNNIYQHLDT